MSKDQDQNNNTTKSRVDTKTLRKWLSSKKLKDQKKALEIVEEQLTITIKSEGKYQQHWLTMNDELQDAFTREVLIQVLHDITSGVDYAISTMCSKRFQWELARFHRVRCKEDQLYTSLPDERGKVYHNSTPFLSATGEPIGFTYRPLQYTPDSQNTKIVLEVLDGMKSRECAELLCEVFGVGQKPKKLKEIAEGRGTTERRMGIQFKIAKRDFKDTIERLYSTCCTDLLYNRSWKLALMDEDEF